MTSFFPNVSIPTPKLDLLHHILSAVVGQIQEDPKQAAQDKAAFEAMMANNGGGLNLGNLAKGWGGVAHDTKSAFVTPFTDFAQHPGIGTGIGAAAAFPFGPGQAGRLTERFTNPRQRARAEIAIGDASQPTLVSGQNDISTAILNAMERLQYGARPRAGRAYHHELPPLPGEDAASLRRIVMNQHKETGTIHAAAGGYHHGEVLDAIGIPRAEQHNYLQHEYHPPSSDQEVPGRLHMSLGNMAGDRLTGDSRKAQLTRARFIDMVKQKGGVLTPGTETKRWYYGKKDLMKDNPTTVLAEMQAKGLVGPKATESQAAQSAAANPHLAYMLSRKHTH